MKEDEENNLSTFSFLRLFDKRITLGNLMTIVIIIIYGTLFYSKMESHLADHTRHISEREFILLFDSRYELLSRPMMTEFRLSNSSVERQLSELKNEVKEIRKELDLERP